MRFLKEILTTILVGAALGGGAIVFSAYLRLPLPEPSQRPVFLVGAVLFSAAFRLLMATR